MYLLETLLLAIGFVLAFEGALYALFPTFLRAMLRQMETISDNAMRIGGVVALLCGVGLVALVS